MNLKDQLMQIKEVNTNLETEMAELKSQLEAKDVEIANMKETLISKEDLDSSVAKVAELETELSNAKETLASFEKAITLTKDEYVAYKLADVDENVKETISGRILGETKEDIDASVAKELDYIKNLKESLGATKKEIPGSSVNDKNSVYSGIASPEMLKKILV